MNADYIVVFQEHDSTPWTDGHKFTRAGAWKRIRELAGLVVPDWPHPIFVRVWRAQAGRARVLVFSGDLRNVRPHA